MFRLLKKGAFEPHASSCYNATAEQIKKKTVEMSTNFSNQLYETGVAKMDLKPGESASDLELDTLANIITHELLYYHQVGEIGCFLASALVDHENDQAHHEPSSDESDGEENEDNTDFGVLCRSMSCDTPSMYEPPSPKANHLSANLLIASGNIRKKIGELFMNMGLVSEQFLLGAAGYINSESETQQRHNLGLITNAILVRLGGGSFKRVEITSPISLNQILAEITEIAKISWSLINLCAMCNAFRFADTKLSLFHTIQVDPFESVFGNYGWTPSRAPQQFESDDVSSYVPQQFESDDVSSYVPQQFESDAVGS
jgi:hypothetical protein